MEIFMMERSRMEVGMGLENLHNIMKRWYMRENGRRIKGKDMEDRFGLINQLFKGNG